MSKPIKLTEELLHKIQEEFLEKVRSVKMFDGKLEYSRAFKWEDNDKATIYLSTVAFAKMNSLIQQFSDEIAWHGVVHRDEEDSSIFYITDILVYPQVVTGSTVNTDQDAYQTWLYSFDDEVFNNIRMQGHSHVNMGVSPSGVDTTHQEKILEQITEDDYYIFMIWNKRYDHFVRIFDLKNNTLYETDDVDVYIGDEGVNLRAFLEGAKAIVTKKTYTPSTTVYQGTTYQSGYQSGGYQSGRVTSISTQTGAATTTVKTKPKGKGGSADIGKSYSEYSGVSEEYYNSIYSGE